MTVAIRGQQARAAAGAAGRPWLGVDLVRRGLLSGAELLRILALGGGAGGGLPRLLRSHGLVEDRALALALAEGAGLTRLTPRDGLPDPLLIAALGERTCVSLGCLPWRRIGAAVLVAVTDPAAFAPHGATIAARLGGPLALAVIGEGEFQAALAAVRAAELRRRAEDSVPAAESCRDWDARRLGRAAAIVASAAVVLALTVPVALVLGLLAIMLVLLTLATGLRLAAALAALSVRRRPPESRAPTAALPVVSILVPLHAEPDIAPRLVARLGVLDYPRDRLDVLLVVEAGDRVTRAALADCRLPGWMRVIVVPPGQPQTKPRALNYALSFARGDLIGVYDAEDAPARDQLHAVVAAFARGGPRLACVQGVLDFYNPTSNWMSRCFTIEYAAWFRLILPGLARLGLVVPLGGTTLFFRRDILEALGGWDAHNVTEDADLGVRLARHGWRTELMSSVTLEEANCRVWPWVKQRSRWLKGYAMTYAVHMRDPRRLWRQLGAWRFFGFQVLFLGTLVQFLFAPVFWSLWLLTLGLEWTPAQALPSWGGLAILGLLLGAEVIGTGINLAALDDPRHRWLRPWVLTLFFYFPLATLAAWKAAWEMLRRPFYWDKTAHGLHDGAHRPVVTLI